jgi:hypothetical protein
MKKSLVLFVATIIMLSAVLTGCPPPLGRPGHGPRPPHPPIPHR